MSFTALVLGSFAALSVSPQEASAGPAVELLTHAQLSAELKAIAEAHPDLVQLHKLGDSRAGLAIEALRLAGPGTDEPRPAILLVANIDGARLFASAVALHHAQALAEGYASDERVKTLLNTTSIWIVPRANPDAAEARFETPREERRASGVGVDNDRDGRQGEDPAADLDGDGSVSWIRVKDPDGEWREDPTEPRALVKADRNKGEHGIYLLWPEGRDLDHDERVAEDPAQDGRVDRNFPAGWEQHGEGAGLFATDDPETRGLCDLVLAHPEIALVVVYDAQDDLVGEVKSVADDAPRVKLVPPEGVLDSDQKLLAELGKRYRKATGSTAKGEAGDRGSFSRWCYEQRGLITLSMTLWDIPLEEKKKEEKKEEEAGEKAGGDEEKSLGERLDEQRLELAGRDAELREEREEAAAAAREGAEGAGEAPQEQPAAGKGQDEKGDEEKKDDDKKDDEPKPSDDAKRLKWIDTAGAEEAWRFLPWKPFEHPELGPVEIGGFAPFSRLEPPAAERAEIARKHLEFFLGLGALLPRVALAECTRETLGEGVFRVTAVVQNDALLPLLSRSGRRTETTRPAKVQLELPEAARLLGGEIQVLLSELPGSGGRKEYTWLVQGPEGTELGVSVETAHAGKVFREAEEEPR